MSKLEAEGDSLLERLILEDRAAVDPEQSPPMDSLSPITRTCSPSRIPSLPIELWTAIISHITDSQDVGSAWLIFRRVSRGFEAATEAAMRQQLMRRTRLDFINHRTKLVRAAPDTDALRRVQLDSLVMRFDRWSEDGETVFFRDASAKERLDEELLRNTLDDWKHKMMTYLGQPECDCPEHSVVGDHNLLPDEPVRVQYNQPPHIITVGDLVNDTELPGLKVDFDRLELSFLWRPMLTMFFAEEERIRLQMRAVKDRGDSRISDLRQRLRTRRVCLDDALTASTSTVKMQEQIRRKVRLHRFQHNLQRKGSPLAFLVTSYGRPVELQEYVRLACMRDMRETLAKDRHPGRQAGSWKRRAGVED